MQAMVYRVMPTLMYAAMIGALAAPGVSMAQAPDAPAQAASAGSADEANLLARITELDNDPERTWNTPPQQYRELLIQRRTEQVRLADEFLKQYPESSSRHEVLGHKLMGMFILSQVQEDYLAVFSTALDAMLANPPDRTSEGMAKYFKFQCDSYKKLNERIDQFELSKWQREFLGQYLKDYPESRYLPEALFALVVLHWNENLNEEGMKYYEVLRSRYADHPYTMELAGDANRRGAIGRPFELKFTAMDGREVDIASMKGKVVLVDFWATWCGPCRITMPELIEVHRKYNEKGFEVVGISLDHSKPPLEEYVRANRIPWPQYFDGKGWGSAMAQKFGVTSIPTTFLVDKKGHLRATEINGRLEAEVQRLLAEQG